MFARSVEGVACHQAFGSRDFVGLRIPAFHPRPFKIFRLDLFFGRFVGSGSSEDIGLRSLIVNPVGIGKKSFPSDKFSGQASPSNMSTPAFNQ